MGRQIEIQIPSEQGIKLKSDECSLGNDGSMLFLNGKEMLVSLAVGKDNSLTAKGSYLRSTNVKNIAMACQIRQGDIARR